VIAVEGGSKPQTGRVADLGRGDVRWRKRFDNVQRALQVLERSATRLAFQIDLISDGEAWMAMVKARNQSSHTYNLEQAQAIARDVIERFAPLTAPGACCGCVLRTPSPLPWLIWEGQRTTASAGHSAPALRRSRPASAGRRPPRQGGAAGR